LIRIISDYHINVEGRTNVRLAAGSRVYV